MSKQHKIPFVGSASDVPFLKFNLGDGTEGYAIIDTGSEQTMFDAVYIGNHPSQFKLTRTKEKIDLVHIGSKTERNLMHAHTTLILNDGSENLFFSVDGIVAGFEKAQEFVSQHFNIYLAGIIGSDFLKATKAKIDFRKRTISFSDDISGKRQD